MRFADFIIREATRVPLAARDKAAVFQEMVQALAETGALDHNEQDGLVRAILKREELGVSVSGRGVAITDIVYFSMNRVIANVAVSPAGVDFGSLDGEMVRAFLLVVAPPNRRDDFIRILTHISREFRNDDFCNAVKQARTVEEIQQLLDKTDGKQCPIANWSR